MTTLLYQNDSYLQTFKAVVSGVDEENHAVTLNQSAFYPGGGGQPYDTGELSGDGARYPVVRARKSEGQVFHMIEASAPLPLPGLELQGQIDWARRYQLMRTHTAITSSAG